MASLSGQVTRHFSVRALGACYRAFLGCTSPAIHRCDPGLTPATIRLVFVVSSIARRVLMSSTPCERSFVGVAVGVGVDAGELDSGDLEVGVGAFEQG